MKYKPTKDLGGLRLLATNFPTMRHSRKEAHLGQQEKATLKRRKLIQIAKQSRRRNRS